MDHTYYFINRPPFIGTHPKEHLAQFEPFYPPQQVEEQGIRYFHGWATYTEPLTFEQIWKYELWPADPDENNRYYEWREDNDK